MAFHKDETIANSHYIHRWEYASVALMNAATGFVAADVGRLCRITISPYNFYQLTDTAPTWRIVSSSNTSTRLTESFTGITGTANVVLAQIPLSTTGPLVFFNGVPQIYGSAYTIVTATRTVTFAQNLVADDIIIVSYEY